MIEIKGIIHDLNNQPILGVIIEVFEHSFFSNLDRLLAPAEVSDSTGSFNIVPVSGIQPDVQKIYLIITDSNKKFSSIKDRENRFCKVIDFQGNNISPYKEGGKQLNVIILSYSYLLLLVILSAPPLVLFV